MRIFVHGGEVLPMSRRMGEVDLGKDYDVRAVQINFADDQVKAEPPVGGEPFRAFHEERYIDTVKQYTRWLLEGSVDGEEYFVIEDKREAQTDYSHDFLVWEEGIRVRFLKLIIEELPYNAVPCVSGIRVFGLGEGEAPKRVEGVTVRLDGDLDMEVSWEKPEEESNTNISVVGYNILWGHAPDKLYHSYMVFGANRKRIGALVKGQPVYVRVDVFNEVGITEGEVLEVRT